MLWCNFGLNEPRPRAVSQPLLVDIIARLARRAAGDDLSVLLDGCGADLLQLGVGLLQQGVALLFARLVQLGERENGGECDEGNEGDAEPAQRLTGRQQHERPDEGGTLVLDIGQRHDRECTVPDGVCHTRGKAIGSIGRNRKPRQLLVTGKFRLHEP